MIDNAKTIEILEDGHVVNTIVASEEVAEQMFPGTWRVVVEQENSVAPEVRHVTVLAFRNRFTRAEKIRIELAGLDDPAASQQTRERAAVIRVGQADLAAATFVDLDRQGTRDDVLAFDAMGLLDSPDRALSILDAPILLHERP